MLSFAFNFDLRPYAEEATVLRVRTKKEAEERARESARAAAAERKEKAR